MAFLLDSNVFITAKHVYYGFDFCPAFWDWIQREHEAGTVLSIDRVGEELMSGNDELVEWASQMPPAFFPPLAPTDTFALNAVVQWVSEQDYTEPAIVKFVAQADCYLVAQALAGRHTVVTLESRARSQQKIKIPNVCAGVDVECINTFQMLRRERARFVLGSPP